MRGGACTALVAVTSESSDPVTPPMTRTRLVRVRTVPVSLFVLIALGLAPCAIAQVLDPPSAIQALQQQRNALIQDIWTNGYTCLKPEYRPTIQSVFTSVATPDAVRASMLRERQVLAESQKALKASQMADSHWRILGQALDVMMGMLLGAGYGGDGQVVAAERVLSAQGFIDQANAMITCTTYRQQKLREISDIDAMIAQKDKPIRFPGRPDAGRPRNSPYAF